LLLGGQLKLEVGGLKIPEIENVFVGEKYTTLKNDLFALMLRQKDLVFKKSNDPDGHAWAPISEKTKNARNNKKRDKSKDKILIDTGTLKNSITNASAPYQIGNIEGNEIVLGVGGLEYAAIHQYGGVIERPSKMREFSTYITIPARPYLGFGNADEEAISEHILHFMTSGGK
jgi:phage virion morphogenesis protein